MFVSFFFLHFNLFKFIIYCFTRKDRHQPIKKTEHEHFLHFLKILSSARLFKILTSYKCNYLANLSPNTFSFFLLVIFCRSKPALCPGADLIRLII